LVETKLFMHTYIQKLS